MLLHMWLLDLATHFDVGMTQCLRACRLEGMGYTKMINDLDARIAASKVQPT